MPEQDAPALDSEPEPTPGRQDRLDAAHDGPEIGPRAEAVAAARAIVAEAEQAEGGERKPALIEDPSPVLNHANSLASRLQQRQEEIDRRASLLDSQEADVEAKLRSARLWFEEQHRELDQREADLAEREEALDRPAPPAGPDPFATQALAESEQELAEREQQLDSRQAELYEQLEKLSDERARIADRATELDTLQQQLDEQTKHAAESRRRLSQDSADLEVSRAELTKLHEEIANQQADVAARERQLAARRAEIEAALKRLHGLGVTEQRLAEAQQREEEFAIRARYLDDAETMLTDEKTSLAEERRAVEQQRRDANELALAERRRVETERQAERVELERRERLVADREAELEQRQDSLDQFRTELEATQREVLEMRLATEETWGQLAGALAPASLTRSIAQVRAQLADHYQHALRDLADRREELKGVTAELADEHQRLEAHRANLQQWATRREEDIEQRAARLIAREHELDRQQRHYEEREAGWRTSRDELRDRLRQLMADIRRVSPDEPQREAA